MSTQEGSSRLGQAVHAALTADAALAQALPGFRPRPAQQRLAVAVAEAFERRDLLLAEAGTGTGKTFAYLVPALLSGMKTIVSTGTRALQDQLYLRDLPRVRDALGVGLKTALLKGRANYLCRYRVEQAKGEPRFQSREQVSQFQRIVAWSGRTRSGDLAEMASLPEDSPLLPIVTSTTDNCVGTDCPFWSECFVVQARQRAQAADVVVVNHHLLLADLALKQEGFGEILPGAQAFVIDEAHQLPELAAQFFGEGTSARPLVELAREAIGECKSVPGALAVLQAPAQALEAATRALRAAMDNLPVRGTAWRALDEVDVEPALRTVVHTLHTLQAALEPLRQAAPGLDACHVRAHDHALRLQRWLGEADTPTDTVHTHWFELTPRGFRLQRTPLDVSAPLRAHREQSNAAWVFTSATLAVAGTFAHMAQRLGIEQARELIEPSPFDWDRQALCYLPTQLPEPAAREYGQAVLAAVQPVLQASAGRAFLLFASHRALREAAEALKDAPWPLFVQGSEPRHVLLQRFRDSGNGVLLGTASFREGVDVAGDALSVVIIDKLPFAAPDDPVFEARLDAIRRAGGNPFRDEQLPQAVIALKQGAGRLIRTETDRGVLVLCDPRLTQKSYGRVFLESLPPLPITRALAQVQAFFADAETADAGAKDGTEDGAETAASAASHHR
ncbi:MAG TPA: ATP-dependent DNA helicase [Thermomonas sp.]|jgi:ATP-dependent DNA helicase DinG|uniref:ATP-dependent DNA helicase n=1 Tax=Thermomonas sp. TaxID=1971895 RepID=UPI002CDCABA3|nr:ATP-dependent DNA helicase [Thermomonas sp.]HOV95370.1 ATP-dependent DNA helicase [Thermomonas sp.]